MFTLALIFAGTNTAFGQVSATPDVDHLDVPATYCPTAVDLTCGVGTALNPMPGVPYDYTITSTTTTGKIHWFVTDESTLISTQGTIAAAIEPKDGTSPYVLTADAAYNDPAVNTSKTVNITWKPFDGVNNNVILVVYNVDDANCTDNMEVYRIEPQYAFTLDIAGIADAGTTGGAAVEDCVNPIQTASYDGTTQTLTVDYGTDYVFFAVNAANWQTAWMPDDFAVTATGLTTPSTVTVTGWAYPADAATGGNWNTVGTDPVLASAYPAGTSSNGFVAEACIIVRVQVDHGTTTENLTDEVINLTVNGEMINAGLATPGYDGTYLDLDEPATAGNPCESNLTTDNMDITITPRPAIVEDTPTPFEDKTPNEN